MRQVLRTAGRSPRSDRATNRRRTLTEGTDLYLGPQVPSGKESNWLATVPGKGYFVILRLYGPTEAAIDTTWKPGDIEKAP
jgi:hypothetical protein